MADKIKIIVEKLIKAGVDMNTFLKASGSSIQEKIAEINGLYTARVRKPKYKRKRKCSINCVKGLKSYNLNK